MRCGRRSVTRETLLEDVPFPQADPAALVRDAVTLAVQVNGKLRGTIEVRGRRAARRDRARWRWPNRTWPSSSKGLSVRKVIVVPGKIVNIVAG